MTRKSLLLACCFLFALLPLESQTNYADSQGSVLDPQHRPIPGARLRITSVATSSERTVTANGSGLYEIPGLLPGEYGLRVESQGFAASTRRLQLEVGQEMTLDVGLMVGGDTQTVVATTSAELLKTTDASVSEVVDQHS